MTKKRKNISKGFTKRKKCDTLVGNADFFAERGRLGLQGTRVILPDFTNRLPGFPRKKYFILKGEKTMLNKEVKQNLIKEYAVHEGDTGSPEVQIAILSKRISELTEHLKKNPKDNHSRRGMQQMIGKRRKFLNYLLKNDIERYRSVIERLGIRK